MESSTEHRILEAAKTVFTQKGYAAARMQEIADTAGINKGLLHYYFRNKEKLFLAVFDEAFAKFTRQINEIFESSLPLMAKIEAFVDQYIDILIENPHLPGFILNELNQHPEAFAQKILQKKDKPNPLKLIIQVQLEAELGRIRKVNPVHFFLNLIAMCVFPFVARPLIQTIVQIDSPTYIDMMKTRKKEIVDFVVYALEKRTD